MTMKTPMSPWLPVSMVFAAVLIVQLWFVARAGTDIPFQDQWDVEGRWLYSASRDGTLQGSDLFRPHNEHRIFWTHLLNLALFKVNGQWDPLVQLAANAFLRAGSAALLVFGLSRTLTSRGRWLLAVGVAGAFLPHLAWHNALWGFQSQVYFSLLFSLLALWAFTIPEPSRARQALGFGSGAAALFAMGAGAFVPVALIALIVMRAVERRHLSWSSLLGPMALLIVAVLLRVDVPEHAALRAENVGDFLRALARSLAWPHVEAPAAALVLNLPLAMAVATRLGGWRRAAGDEDFAIAVGFWAAAAAGAQAWLRGGSAEFAANVPSRYLDFMVLLPFANAFLAVTLAREWAASGRSRRIAVALVSAWGVFLFVGWLGLSTQMWRGIVRPRFADREAPVRLAVAYQRSRDVRVFAGQPRLLVPHPHPHSIVVVLEDPRLAGALPPAFQPERPLGPLSRFVRRLFGHQ